MGSSGSKATSGAKSAARHFPAANVIQERATNAAASATTTSGKTTSARAAATSSPKQDYLEDQRRLEEELAKYDEQLKKSGKFDGESRPLEDTPSASEIQFFGNLKSIGQVKVPNPDQIKHQEAEAILRRKLPVKPISSSSNAPVFAQSSPTFPLSSPPSTSANSTLNGSGPHLTSLKLMQLLQLRNQDPSLWTVEELSKEFSMKKDDIKALTKYVNTYAILPGKDAKGRELGVWCEDLRGVEVLDKPTSVMDSEEETSGSRPEAESETTKVIKAAKTRT